MVNKPKTYKWRKGSYPESRYFVERCSTASVYGLGRKTNGSRWSATCLGRARLESWCDSERSSRVTKRDYLRWRLQSTRPKALGRTTTLFRGRYPLNNRAKKPNGSNISHHTIIQASHCRGSATSAFGSKRLPTRQSSQWEDITP